MPETNNVAARTTANGLSHEHDSTTAAAAGASRLRAAAEEERAPDLCCLADVQPEAVRWLWWRYIPRGAVTLLDGDPGVGKSCIAMDLAARVAAGHVMPDGTPGVGPSSVVYMTTEDDPETVLRPRAEAAGADLARMHLLEGVMVTRGEATTQTIVTLQDLDILAQAMAALHPALVIIDPIQAYLGYGVDAYRAEKIRPVMDGVSRLAREYNCAVLVLRHLRKSSADHAIHRGWGSLDFGVLARSVLLAGVDPADRTRRAIAPTKASWSAEGSAIGYRLISCAIACGIETAAVEWTGPSDLTPAAMLAPEPANPAEERSALEEALAWLRAALADGPIPSRDLQRQAKADGIAWRTLERAKRTLAVEASHRGPHGETSPQWFWRLPDPAPAPRQHSDGGLGGLP